MNPPERARHVTSRLRESLEDTRVVVVQGARQVGKTTLVTQIIHERSGHLVTLDDDVALAAAQADPAGFLKQNSGGLLAIDEVQRAPSLTLALKLAVDRDQRPGQFLLTGSADLLHLPTTADSLAGRAEDITLYGFSQGEIAGERETFIDRLLSGTSFTHHGSQLTRADYLTRACGGGYPEALTRPDGRRRAAWFDNYIRRIVERDAPDVSRLHRLSDLPLLLRMLASRNATEITMAGLSSDVGIPVRTLGPYIDLLETLYLVHRLPAWSTNLTKRVVSRPKVALLDTGLAARLMNVSPTGVGPGANAEAAGQLLEGFVAGEVRRQLTWSDEAARLFHFRDHDGAEVDLILETDDGRVAAIEVKASSTVGSRDFRWLATLRDRLGSRFVAGLVLHTGPTAVPFGPKLAATPIDVLWSA
ncbi:MAG: ATP-binding protein [Dermatophilaceae bacterium]